MQSEPKRETVVATWRVTSIEPHEESTHDDQGFVASHVDTRGLGSVWHTTSNNGSWSITEALATVCAGLFASSHGHSAAVQLVVPSSVQALLVTSLLRDLGWSNIRVSTAPARANHGASPRAIIVSLPPIGETAASDYTAMVYEVLRHDVRPGVDEVISVGEDSSLNVGGTSRQVDRHRRSSDTFERGRLTDRGDLIRRLLALSPSARKELLQLHSSQDVEDVPVLMRLQNWSDEKVVCLCGSILPPIMAEFAHLFPDDTDILTNSPASFGQSAATSKSLRKMRDFDDEAFLCTAGQWLLVEPELGRGGPHRNATLLMRAASTTLFIIRLALGSLDGAIAVEVPAFDGSAPEQATSNPAEQTPVTPTQTGQAAERSRPNAHTLEQGDKKHRCRRYSDLYEKRLREVLARLSSEEINALFSGLES